ncbi:MAG: TerB family tellurite resistance protein [Daejeonella sp.]
MENNELLNGFSADEKTAYLTSIASIATADHSASQEEKDYLNLLSEKANLTDEQKKQVIKSAASNNEENLKVSLDKLKNSELKYSLMTDLSNFAESDGNFTDDEKQNISKIAEYLGINQEQMSAINAFVKKTSETQVDPEKLNNPNILSALGLEDKFKNSGLNFGSIAKGLLGVVGPMLLSRFLGRNMGGNNSNSGLGGGLGSVISSLNGGRGMGGLGGLLSSIL